VVNRPLVIRNSKHSQRNWVGLGSLEGLYAFSLDKDFTKPQINVRSRRAGGLGPSLMNPIHAPRKKLRDIKPVLMEILHG
jgi:hypothetical protein